MFRALCAALALIALGAAQVDARAGAQAGELRTLEVDGETIAFTLHGFAPGAHLAAAPDSADARGKAADSALDTARMLVRHLAAGDIEEAALLSNAPRRRFEVLRDYRSSVGEEEFKRVFQRYSDPGNGVRAEIAIGRYRLLLWHLKDADHFAGQYYVEVDGRFLIDDGLSIERARLRRVLEAWRAGKIAPPTH